MPSAPATWCRGRSRRPTSISGCWNDGLRAEACLAIEDSGPGLRAARGAGLATIITVSDYTREQDFSDAALVLSDLGESDAPFRVLRGDAAEFHFVSVEALRAWHGREICQRGQSKL